MYVERCVGWMAVGFQALLAQNGVWVDRGVAPSTPSCQGSLLGFDPVRRETVWFGRLGCRETWLWNGTSWSNRTPAVNPPAQVCAGAFDTTRQVLVAVFGNQSTGLQTWEWNGVVWQLRQNGGLQPRQAFGLAFDAARNVTVLFGGYAGNDYGFADTWAWNGTNWTQVMFGGPSPRWSVGMSYDPQNQVVLLFGGEGRINGNQAVHGDTWEWNGIYWLNHFGLPGPPARRAAGRLVRDGVQQRTLLYGGSTLTSTLFDTWSWDGSAWTQLAVTGDPGAGAAELVFDDARGVFVTTREWAAPNTTWELVAGPTVPASWNEYGAGCPGPAGVPHLGNIAGSLPRIGTTLHLQLTNLPPSFINVPIGFFGFDAASWNGLPLPLSLAPLGFPGCSSLLAPASSEGLTNVGGVAAWDVPLPMNALALGAHVYFQAAVLVPGWNPGGFVFSNGGHAVVGTP